MKTQIIQILARYNNLLYIIIEREEIKIKKEDKGCVKNKYVKEEI